MQELASFMVTLYALLCFHLKPGEYISGIPTQQSLLLGVRERYDSSKEIV